MPTFELDHARGRFRTWLWHICRNTLIDWRRRHQSQAKAEERWRQDQAERDRSENPDEPDNTWAEAHYQRVLEFVLQRLKAETQPNTWACFEQHLLLGRRSAEVAGELGLTTSAVYTNASRVLARLRQRCAEYLEDLGHG